MGVVVGSGWFVCLLVWEMVGCAGLCGVVGVLRAALRVDMYCSVRTAAAAAAVSAVVSHLFAKVSHGVYCMNVASVECSDVVMVSVI